MPSSLWFTPVYGWGWYRGSSAIETPEAFELSVTQTNDAMLFGIVRKPDEFAGCTAVLSRREHSNAAEHWSIVLDGERLDESVTGFVQSVTARDLS